MNALTVVSSSEIDYSQFNDGSTPGAWKVQVEGPDGTLSSAVSFTVTALEPTLSSVSPTSYPASSSGQLMELFGSNFASGDKLLYTFPNGTTGFNLNALTVVSSSEIDYSQFNDGSTPGTWKVQVESPDGTLSSAVSFTVAVAAPSLSSVSPTSYASDTNNHTMQLFGSNLVSGDTLTFTDPQGNIIASTAAKLTFVSSSEINYQFNDASDAGSWSVRVNSADGTLHSSSNSFSVAADDTTYSISPNPATVDENAGTLTFTITRSNGSASRTVYISTIQDQGYYNAASGTTSTSYYYTGLVDVACTFAAGQTSIQVPVSINDRGLTSGSEKFSLEVQDASGTNLASTTFAITNNDTPTTTYSISPSPSTVNENTGTLTFTVTRSNTSQAATVDISTVQDQGYYNAASGTTSTNYYYDGLASVSYTFAAGISSIQVPLTIHDRSLTSGSEKFSFDVESTSGNNLASTTFTIENNDQRPSQPPPTDIAPEIIGPSTLDVTVGEPQSFSSSISATDQDGTVDFYQFRLTSGTGFFTRSGGNNGTSVKVPASQLLSVGFTYRR